MCAERNNVLSSKLTLHRTKRNLEIKTAVQCAVADNSANSLRQNKDAERKQECVSTSFIYH